MDGGAPAGIRMPTPDLGCRTNSTKINTRTIQGNSRTTPRGIEILELPLNRSGRRKKANLDEALVFVLTSSKDGILGVEGRRFSALCMNPIDTISSTSVGEAAYKGLDLPRVVNVVLQWP